MRAITRRRGDAQQASLSDWSCWRGGCRRCGTKLAPGTSCGLPC